MLTGRKSLIRLIGKRRRFLPNLLSLLSSPIDDSPLILCADKDGNFVPIEAKLQPLQSPDEHSSTINDFVTCPVCGRKVIGENSIINSHLDACISKGTKRKLTQRTLLQLDFCSRSKVQVQSSHRPFENNVSCIGPDDSLVKDEIHKYSNFSACKENESMKHELPVHNETRDRINSNINTCALKNDVSGAVLETFIVGRRFSEEKDLNLGASISLERDPGNVKDRNAIKVICMDSGCSKMLGFLPRDLAKYLSPLIDKYCLCFKGHVTIAPTNPFDTVPVEIVCQKMMSLGENGYDIDEFSLLWKNVQEAVDYAKDAPPNTTKYQHNFGLLIEEVLRSNKNLLTDDERSFLELFMLLPSDCQSLFIRLYMRKGPWFRMSTISIKEVSDPKQAVKELNEAGYLCLFENPTELDNVGIREILDMLTVSEIRAIMCKLKKDCNHGIRKPDLISSVISAYEDGSCPPLPSFLLDITGGCIRISLTAEALLWRAERLFFLNGEQDLSSFLLADMGIVKYPTYNCMISDQIFSSRDDLLAYEEAIEVAQLLDQALDDKHMENVLRWIKIADSRMSNSVKPNQLSAHEPIPEFYTCFSASWVYSKVVLLGVSILEREHRYNNAIILLKRLLDIFTCDGRRGYWTLRLSIDLEHMGCLNESLMVAEDGLLDPWVRAGSRIALQRRVLRLGKPPRRWKKPSFSESINRKITEVHVQGRPLNCEAGMKSRFYAESGEQCGVEDLALEYYAGEGGGWHGVHSESGIWLTIFGILMWDIIFSDVPNAFRTRFQTAPLDLETESFYLLRKNIMESHLEKIHDGMAEEILITSWESHMGTACRGVNWDRHSLAELRAAVTCISGPCLASFCRHLAQDYRSWSSGMPDLLLWRFHGEYRGEAKLVEVKGPRDRLSEQQRAWLLLLMDCGFTAEVCKVSPTSSMSA